MEDIIRNKIKKIIIILLSSFIVFVILIYLAYACYVLYDEKPGLEVSTTSSYEKILHRPNISIPYSIKYDPTKINRFIGFFSKKYRSKYIKECIISVNGVPKYKAIYPKPGNDNKFDIDDFHTGSYDYRIECLTRSKAVVSATQTGYIDFIIPLITKEIKNIETANLKNDSIVIYYDIDPNVKIKGTNGFVEDNQFLKHELAMYKMAYGRIKPEFLNKKKLDNKSVVSVGVNSQSLGKWDSKGQIMNIDTDEGKRLIFLPYLYRPPFMAIFYVADDGSTYYSSAKHFNSSNIFDSKVDMTWEEAFQPAHLARKADEKLVWENIQQEQPVIADADKYDRFLMDQTSFITAEKDNIDTSEISLEKILLSGKDLAPINPLEKKVGEIIWYKNWNDMTMDERMAINKIKNESFITITNDNTISQLGKPIEKFFQLLSIANGQNDSFHIKFGKYSNRAEIDAIIKNRYGLAGEKIVKGNAFCTRFDKPYYEMNSKISRNCGFSIDKKYM